ncbi:5-formyltetrahydrofolate cyclo-ligase [Paracraurococcus sp. LOR1-02]|uniref:5-formyltetrahydrofolate cyclo-ligase n=1 Tax=Paracraurococcus lichenis TaxID=3064888 RepID=A0ABT9E6P0_9PROT|nr:5-formyltetrahydrofolate cyclo-ligase [Paracraurococcus sp. LOR1-02]MDO9711762.1 5-formyltetrahydrofolate cyclo-ligase [Paracraurococcus sp. LOR1-02]
MGHHRLAAGRHPDVPGFFDRTLAALSPRPFAVGVGFAAARLATIFPQPHDVPMDLVVTEEGCAVRRAP